MRRLAACAALVFMSAAVHATVVLPIEFRELVTSSAVIVHGRVTDARSAYVDDRRAVDTFVTVAVDEYFKGNLGAHVTFRVPGGQIGRYRTVFVGAPAFTEGDEVVVFLKTPAGGVPFVTGLSQGAFRVMPDASTGRRIVTTPIVMGKTNGDSERIVRGDPARRPLAIDAFRDAVRQVLAEAAAR
jgi:hypothetical protein